MSASLTQEYDMVRGPLTSCIELFEFKRSRTTLVGWAQVPGSCIILSWSGLCCCHANNVWRHGSLETRAEAEKGVEVAAQEQFES